MKPFKHGTYGGYVRHFQLGQLPPCEECKAARRAYYEANRERIAAQQRARREANREQIAAQKWAYYEANRERIAAQQRARRLGPVAPRLVCSTCDSAFDDATGIHAHTLRAHGRPATREERTPRSAA